MTTKERIGRFLPPNCFIYSKNYTWYIRDAKGGDHDFVDGMIISPDGKAFLYPEDGMKSEDERLKRKKDIMKYVRGFIEFIRENGIPQPNGGDCWYCYMDLKDDADHLLSHIEEKYYFGSILYRAIEARGYRDPVLILHMWTRQPGNHLDEIKRVLQKFLYRQLGVC